MTRAPLPPCKTATEERLKFLITLAVVVAAVVLFGWIILLPFRQRVKKDLRRKSLAALEQSVFRYDSAYFEMIGADQPTVQEFRALVEARDLEGIRKRWSALSRDFQRLEVARGHKGRPMLLDHYHWYELELAELRRRSRSA